MGKALALIFTGCGIMLLLNFCIFFLVDKVRKNRNRNRGFIIRKRLNRRRSVSFADLLVNQTVPNRILSISRQPEEIEMVDLSSIPPPPIHDPPPPPSHARAALAPLLKPVTSSLTRQRQPSRPAPPIPIKLSRPKFPPPPPPPPLVRSMSLRLPHRDPSYKTFTIIIVLS